LADCHGRQESKGLNIVGFKEFFVFAAVLAINPESAIPCPGAVAIAAALNGKGFRPLVFIWKTIGVQTSAMRSVADGGIDGNGFSNFGKKVRRDGNLRTRLALAAGFEREFFSLLGNRGGRHIAALRKEGSEAEDEDGLSPKHKNGAAESTSGEEASEMAQIAAVVNLKRLAPVKMSN
jgi:hypothetical protein